MSFFVLLFLLTAFLTIKVTNPQYYQTFTLNDGSELAYTYFGNSNTTLVIYLHGSQNSHLSAYSLATKANDLKVYKFALRVNWDNKEKTPSLALILFRANSFIKHSESKCPAAKILSITLVDIQEQQLFDKLSQIPIRILRGLESNNIFFERQYRSLGVYNFMETQYGGIDEEWK